MFNTDYFEIIGDAIEEVMADLEAEASAEG